jgi:M6 family metalloprotease-like protein
MHKRLLLALLLSTAFLAMPSESAAATAEDFGFDTMGNHPHPSRPLLLLIANFASTPMRTSGGVVFQGLARNPLTRTRAQFDDFVFDYLNSPLNPGMFSGKTVNAAFLEMSAGNFIWTRAASFEPRVFSAQETQALEEMSAPFGDPPGRIYGIETTLGLNYIVGKFLSSNPGFNLAGYDTDGDHVVSAHELTVLLVSNYGERIGANRYLNLAGLPNPADPLHPLTLQGQMAWADHHTSFATWVHELSHSLQTLDLYIGNQAGASGANTYGGYSTLMGGTLDFNSNDNPAIWHLDPWHKMKLGWLRPRLVPMSKGGGFVLRCAQAPGTEGAILLYDDTLPASQFAREFFMIEYRNPFPPVGARYDSDVADTGIIIWHIGTDANGLVYRLPDPTNPPKNPNGPVSVIVEGRNATDNGYSLGGDNKKSQTQVWTSKFYAQLPMLRRFDGSPANARIQASLGPDGNSIFIQWILAGDTWAHFRNQPPGLPEVGTFDLPWNTFIEAYTASPWGGNIRLKSGQTAETGTFSKRTVIFAEGGPVTIGKQ